jgi:acyl dehydratase
MKTIDYREIQPWLGQEIGVSAWLQIDQSMVDQFAQLTGDQQWIHVDPARASREAPSHTTIVHGFFLLALIPQLVAQVYTFEKVARRINCGSNRIRFLRPVPVGSRIRVRVKLVSFEPVDTTSFRFINEVTVENELIAEHPVCFAELITLAVLR